MSFLHINPRELISFLGLFDTATYKTNFKSIQFSVECFSQCAATASVLVAKYMMERVVVKVSWWRSALNESQLATSEHMSLCWIGTEQNRKVLKASQAAYTYAMNDSLIRKLAFRIYRTKSFPATLSNIV